MHGARDSPWRSSCIPLNLKDTGWGRGNGVSFPVPAADEKTGSLSSRRGVQAPVQMVLCTLQTTPGLTLHLQLIYWQDIVLPQQGVIGSMENKSLGT